jgi:NAD(P)-dependent dehydrogenase (short-subunit alcohol dehydrogenase family)
LAGRVAFVTGAGSGMGKNAAKLLAYAGAKVALVDQTRQKVEVVAKELEAAHHEALQVPADVSDSVAMERAVSAVKERWGRIDFVVADAGIGGVWAPIQEITSEEWDRTMAVNLRGAFLAVKHTVPLLKAQGGAIVIVASINGTRIFSNAGATAYSCSKAAEVALAKSLAVELGPFKIRVNVVCPGVISTHIGKSGEGRHLEEIKIPVEYPKGAMPLTGDKPGTSGEVAELIWFLLSDFADHITGSEVYIDGGQSLLQG